MRTIIFTVTFIALHHRKAHMVDTSYINDYINNI